MKIKNLSRIIAVLALATIFLAACTKEDPDVRLDPKLSTSQYSDVTSNSAKVTGFVVAAGEGFTERGVCYNTATAPTISNNKTVYTGTSTAATFVVPLTGLAYATKYYVRAYATTAAGATFYGEEYSFTTAPVLATVTTDEITEIAGTSATGGGNITSTGGADITARGICYSKTPNPTIADNKTSDGTGEGAFTSALRKLDGLTKYYVRAYATNKAGTAYGNEVEFTTLVSLRTWYIPGDYVEASYPGTTLKNWTPADSPQVKSVLATPDNLEGYVYMANTTNHWKFATQPNWNGPNYGDATNSGVLDPNGGDIPSPAGYYKINADFNTMKYTAIATVWGVIGDATPNGWNDETGLTYSPELRTWRGGVALKAGSFKFRANHNWNINYGAKAGEDTLRAGGDNIAAPALATTYYFVLDFSNPNVYKYKLDTWGVIGSATADGWNSDQDMTWDDVNKVLTATLALSAGEIKFRANNNWNVNLGGDVNGLTQNGSNIPIPAAGTYVITLDLGKAVPTCTITLTKKK
jgi:starch-binding outer membrane protein SusE/F